MGTSKKFTVKLTVQSGLSKKIRAYFEGLQTTDFCYNDRQPKLIRVKSEAGWNGHRQGDIGTLKLKHITTVFGRRVDMTVVAVSWTDGTQDWGFHMLEKLEVLDHNKLAEV